MKTSYDIDRIVQVTFCEFILNDDLGTYDINFREFKM